MDGFQEIEDGCSCGGGWWYDLFPYLYLKYLYLELNHISMNQINLISDTNQQFYCKKTCTGNNCNDDVDMSTVDEVKHEIMDSEAQKPKTFSL